MKRGLLFFLLCLVVAGVCPAQGGVENLMLDHRLFSVRMGEYGAVHRYPSGFNMLNDVPDSLYVYGVCYSPLYDFGGISAALLRDDGPAMRDAQSEHPQCRLLCLMPSRFTAKTGISFSCDRGYVAHWYIRGDRLFLRRVALCLFPDQMGRVDTFRLLPSDGEMQRRVEQATGRRFDGEGYLFADWVNDDLPAVTGGTGAFGFYDIRDVRICVRSGIVRGISFDQRKGYAGLPLDVRPYGERLADYGTTYVGWLFKRFSNRIPDLLRYRDRLWAIDYSPLCDFRGITGALLRGNAPEMAYQLHDYALEGLEKRDRPDSLSFGYVRGFEAEWRVERGRLYLGRVQLRTTDLQADRRLPMTDPPQREIDRRVEEATGRSYDADGWLFADWVTADPNALVAYGDSTGGDTPGYFACAKWPGEVRNWFFRLLFRTCFRGGTGCFFYCFTPFAWKGP